MGPKQEIFGSTAQQYIWEKKNKKQMQCTRSKTLNCQAYVVGGRLFGFYSHWTFALYTNSSV